MIETMFDSKRGAIKLTAVSAIVLSMEIMSNERYFLASFASLQSIFIFYYPFTLRHLWLEGKHISETPINKIYSGLCYPKMRSDVKSGHQIFHAASNPAIQYFSPQWIRK
jgi:hypothetical protein